MDRTAMLKNATGLEIAIVGMAGRFPGARSVDEFWQLLQEGREAIAALDSEALRQQGVSPELLNDPQHVKAGGVLADVDRFDAAFFGYSPREAELLDPQQRLFLECAWEALETAGYDAQRYDGTVGVYGGAGMNGYLFNLYSSARIRESASPYELFLASDKDFLTTRVSYKLDLQGPSLDIQTACSSSLVAVHTACQSLLSGECDMALAGGVAVSKQRGYRYQEGGIYSPDGHCRAFDAQAAGTVGGNGVGIVALKRLEDALRDGDTIDAVIKGSAVNNDGARKVSYTAPRIDSQAAVIRAAQAMAEVPPETISYIEAHGTGTALGDPIEIAALTQAFQPAGLVADLAAGSVAIGSVKTNIGHLDAAAGIASLIKAVLALKHRQIPASLHFQQPNPQIDFEQTPFYVNAALADWPQGKNPRRTGVSSFGIGGTNVHVILEEAEEGAIAPKNTPTSAQLLILSAKTEAALEAATANLAAHLERQPVDLADVAYTLQMGRRPFSHRRTLVCQSPSDAVRQLQERSFSSHQAAESPSPVAFMFSGQGSQHPGMARQLYGQPVFRESLERCAELLAGEGIALLDLLNQGGEEINQTAIAQPLLFAVEYALAQLWQSWGVRPEALIGHSLGEYVAACLAGVFSLEDGLRLVALRGRLMQQCPAGAMLSVGLSEGQLAPLLPEGVVIAAVNGPALCAVSGTEAAIAALAADLEAKDIPHQRLQTSHGFHSPLMEPMLEPFRVALQQVPLQPPQIPMVSNVTGTWLTAEAATDPDYWVRQARQPVRFMAGLETLSSLSPVLLEVGPGTVLTRLTGQTLKDAKAIASLPHPKSATPEWTHLLEAAGQLWQQGVPLDWQQLHPTPRRRVPLPTYPFERQRYWVEPDEGLASGIQIETKPALASDLANWFYQPTWQRSLPSTASVLTEPNCWLVLTEGGLGAQLAQRLEQAGQDVIRVARGEAFAQTGYRQFALNPQRLEDYAALMKDLRLRELVPTQVVSLWGLQADDLAAYRQATEVQYLVNAITAQPDQDCQISLVTTGLYDVVGEAVQQPMRGAIAGLSLVIGQEYPSLGCRLIELEDTEAVEPLWRTLIAPPTAIVIACRRSHLWQQTYQPLPLPEAAATRLQRGGTYLIAGNLSQGMGHIWAEHLAAQWQAKLVLLGDRSTPTLPKEAEGIALSLDLTDPAQLSAALQQAEAELGPIRGLFYSAPTTNDQSAAPLALMQPSHWDYNLRHKLQGLLSLQVALAEKPLDFCLVQSSLSAVIGGVGLGAYAAANSAMDAIIQQQNQQSGTPWFSVNWDACLTEEVQAGFGSANAAFALTSEEVWAATERILEAAPPGQIVVSKGGLTTRIRQWVQAAPRPQADEPTATHARPQIATPYAPPRSDIEQTVAAIWQDLLGVEQVGIHDSFFDLGGHSLLAIQVVSRLREAFPVAIEMRSLLFEAPTVAGIAAAIAPHLPDEEEMDEMAALLAEVQGLSSEEVQQQLAQSQGGAQ